MVKYFNIVNSVVTKVQRFECPIVISRCENINSKVLTKYFCRG
jgi:hypothetical protein